MQPDEKRANALEYQNRRIVDGAKRRDFSEEKQRKDDMLAVANTAAGKRLLVWLVGKDKAAAAFTGSSRDYYNLGRYRTSEELREALEKALPRETYIDIVFPKKEE